MNCTGCHYWRSPDTIRGHCLLNPPVVMLMPVLVSEQGIAGKPSRLATPQPAQEQLLPTSHRPVTVAADFCSHWKQRSQ